MDGGSFRERIGSQSRMTPMELPEEQFNARMLEALQTAEVMSVFFVRVGRSLILDMRRDDDTGPAAMLDDIVSTPQARLQSFRRLRPGLPLPERLTLAPWTGAVREFEQRGLLDVVLERCRLEGGDLLTADAAQAFHKLEILEQKYLRDLVRGVGMQTIWQRSDP
jgi:hypothetical protein